MTSMPASRSARAMIFAPRSWPSRPGLATTTRIFLVEAAMPGIIRGVPRSCARPCRRRAGSGSLRRSMVRPDAHPDAAALLRTEHAVARVLACASGEEDAYPGLLAAIGESLDCAGAVWLPGDDGELRCAETWPAGAAVGAALVAGAPVAERGAFAFPLPGVGAMAFAT